MLSFLLAAAAFAPTLAPPTPWALGFAPERRIPSVGDLDADGYADLICVSPGGDSFIDVAISHEGQKSMQPRRANSNWGKDCQGAAFGDFDGDKKTDVVGLFGGDSLRLANGYEKGTFKDTADWVKLPGKVDFPHIAWIEGAFIIWNEKTGDGFRVSPGNKQAVKAKLPKDVIHLVPVSTPRASAAVFTFADGRVMMSDKAETAPTGLIGKVKAGQFPVIANAWIFVDEVADGAPTFVQTRPGDPFPEALADWASGDMDNDGDEDLVQFRYGREKHTTHNVLIHRFIKQGETDSDRDGLTNEQEAALGTDPLNPDTDNDGLLDGWETGSYRGIDMKALGCDPKRLDVIVQVSRYEDLDQKMSETEMERVQGYYKSLGWALHVIWLDPIKKEDQDGSWQSHQEKLHPHNLRGVTHWMQITPGGGGQANQLGDGGTCGGNGWTLYATFIHEFGHQLGLSHTGFYSPAWCPTYPSMMNYAYSYTLEGSIRNIRYSDGALADYKLNEADLDETIPLPYEKVKFLAAAPYHYRMKENGDTTLIDWNWNGVFGEKHVRADINYSYSTTSGERHTVDKTNTSPWIVAHDGSPYVVYGKHDFPMDKKIDPTVSNDRPGKLMLRRVTGEGKWGEPLAVGDSKVSGDPVAVSYGDELVVAHPSPEGLVIRWIKLADGAVAREEVEVMKGNTAVPSLGVHDGRLVLLEWEPKNGAVRYRWLRQGHTFGYASLLRSAGKMVFSTIPVGMASDTDKNQVILGLAQDQDANRPSRWQVRRYTLSGDDLVPVTATPEVVDSERDWVEGEKGGSRGRSRAVVLYDSEARTGMKGRVLFYSLGMTSSESPWACAYVAQSVGDVSVGGGWMVKRFYDEWTQSRSAPAACWFNGEILYAYRWVHGSQGDTDNNLHLSFFGTGIEDRVMGDFDDIGFMKSFGVRHSILYLRR